MKPALGESGVGGAMAVYGAFDAIVSIEMQQYCYFAVGFTLLLQIEHLAKFSTSCITSSYLTIRNQHSSSSVMLKKGKKKGKKERKK